MSQRVIVSAQAGADLGHSSRRRPTAWHRGPWAFFVSVIAWSWLFWIPAAALGKGTTTGTGATLWALGGLGPMLGGIVWTYMTYDTQGQRDYWRRIIDPTRIGARWYLVLFLLAPVLLSLTSGLDLLSGGNPAPFAARFAPFLAQPVSLVPFALGILFLGPFPEELGWRGYALDQLQARWSALASSLLLGVAWAVWHVPLFFIKGTFQYQQGAWTAWFWLFLIGIVPLAVIFTWIFNNTRRSTLATILFHFTVVFTYEFLNATLRTQLYSTLLWILAAILVTSVWGARTLTRTGTPPSR
jgi:uncharacterized protein